MINFCNFAEYAEPNQINCDLFKPTPTVKGLCFTLNTLSVTDLYKQTHHLIQWHNIMGENETNILFKADGFGPSHGYSFILNYFDLFLRETPFAKFQLSITNENNPFDVYINNYVIEPG